MAQCPNSHENDPAAQFCSTCGAPLATGAAPATVDSTVGTSETLTDTAEPVDHSDAAGATPGPEVSAAAQTRPTSSRRTWVVVGVSAAIALVLAVGGLFAFQLITAFQQGTTWGQATAAASGGTLSDDGTTISFESDSRNDCDADDYQTWSSWGSRTDWDALGRCEDRADLRFATSAVETFDAVVAFADSVGIPGSFEDQLSQLRGLDGRVEETYSTSAGEVTVTFAYDGGNGLFVQFERQ